VSHTLTTQNYTSSVPALSRGNTTSTLNLPVQYRPPCRMSRGGPFMPNEQRRFTIPLTTTNSLVRRWPSQRQHHFIALTTLNLLVRCRPSAEATSSFLISLETKLPLRTAHRPPRSAEGRRITSHGTSAAALSRGGQDHIAGTPSAAGLSSGAQERITSSRHTGCRVH
jgi:hypothetical protein